MGLARSLLSSRVRLSVRLSVTLVDSIHTAEDILKRLIRPGSPISLVFCPMRRYPILRGSAVDTQYTRGGEICDFRLKSPFISETVRDRPIVAMER